MEAEHLYHLTNEYVIAYTEASEEERPSLAAAYYEALDALGSSLMSALDWALERFD
jgi:hypothetical protein